MTRLATRVVWTVLLLSGAGWAQSAFKLKLPATISNIHELGVEQVKFLRMNKMSLGARAALNRESALLPLIASVPHWSGSFVYQGTLYPYTMVGTAPQTGAFTYVPTQMIPISMFFDGYADRFGNPVTIDVTPALPFVNASPNFHNAPYDSGNVQFGDAVQRAEFFHVLAPGWHTVLGQPHPLTPVNVEVPVGLGQVFQTPDGTLLALVDVNFFISQLNTIVQLEPLKATSFSFALTNNIFLTDPASPGSIILGFHTAFNVGPLAGNTVQTFAWATYISDPQIFDDGNTEDVLALSHEISEWMNDPFVNNLVPPWLVPGGGGACQNDLETGDAVENLPNSAFPVFLHGFLFHPQNEALLQWFERKVPSDAIDGAYSFPNRGLLTSPSSACPAAH